MNLKQARETTAINSSDIILLGQLDEVIEEYPDLTSAYLIGSLATKLLIASEYKGRVNSASDVDLYMRKIPEYIKDSFEEDRVETWLYGWGLAGPIEVENKEPFTIYHGKDENSKNIGITENTAGVNVNEESLDNICLSMSDGRQINIPSPVSIIASQLFPLAYTHKRDKKLRFIIESIDKNPIMAKYDLNSLAKDVAGQLSVMGVGKMEFGPVMRYSTIKNMKGAKQYVNFLNNVNEQLPYISS